MRAGHTELRRWTSADGRRSAEIDVYVPASISDQHIASASPGAEAAVEREIRSLQGEVELQPLGPILLRSEGIASSRIEGEVASTRRVLEAEYAVSDRQARVIVNSIRVMRDVIADAEAGVSPATFDQWHERLFESVLVTFEPGATRTRQSWIGTRTDTPVGADFVPPPPELVQEALEDLARFVNRTDVAPLTQAAVAHSQFETIHPYPDGNGRVGRALIYRSWAYRGVTTGIAPPISRVMVENREGYLDGLTAYREGDLDGWLGFFFDVVQSATSYTRALARRIENLHGEWMERLAGAHEDALARRITSDLSIRPVVSASDVAQRYEVTERGARAALDDLVERGVMTFRSLRKSKRGRPSKVYEATELFSLLDLRPQDLA